MSIKTQKDGFGSLWVGEHGEVLEGWHTQRGHGNSVPLPYALVSELTAEPAQTGPILSKTGCVVVLQIQQSQNCKSCNLGMFKEIGRAHV